MITFLLIVLALCMVFSFFVGKFAMAHQIRKDVDLLYKRGQADGLEVALALCDEWTRIDEAESFLLEASRRTADTESTWSSRKTRADDFIEGQIYGAKNIQEQILKYAQTNNLELRGRWKDEG